MYQFAPNIPRDGGGQALQLPGITGIGDFSIAIRFVWYGYYGGMAQPSLFGWTDYRGGSGNGGASTYCSYAPWSDYGSVSNSMQFGFGTSPINFSQAAADAPARNQVHTLVVTRSATTGAFVFYLDGVSTFSGTTTTGTFDMPTIGIGNIYDYTNNTVSNQNTYFYGAIGDFGLWQSVLSGSDITGYVGGTPAGSIGTPTYNLPLISGYSGATVPASSGTPTVLPSVVVAPPRRSSRREDRRPSR